MIRQRIVRKPLFERQWIKIRPMVGRWQHIDATCKLCGRQSLGLRWYNIDTKLIYCTTCFTPEGY